jgi:regulator of protease activity HflC (stomatin/prohibitin superfamily)
MQNYTPLIILLVLIFIFSGFRIIRPTQLGLIERFGKFNRIASQGLTWIIPFIDKIYKVNTTEINLDVYKQMVITKDNLNLEIDAMVYFRVVDPKKAIYEVNNFMSAIPSLAQTTLRSIIGEMPFVEVNAQRQAINLKIEQELDNQTKTWGIDVLRVELQDVQPSLSVQQAMDKVVTAEREREAKVTASTAEKEASRELAEAEVIKAEADKRSKIERAEGDARSTILRAEAEAKAIKLVNEAAEASFLDNAKAYKAMEVTENSLKHNTKVILTEKGISSSIILNAGKEEIVPVNQNKSA